MLHLMYSSSDLHVCGSPRKMGAAVEEEKHSAEEEDNKLAVQV
jgi:hypothetical protein